MSAGGYHEADARA